MPRYYLCVDVPEHLDHAFRNGYTGLTAGDDGNPLVQAQAAINAVLPALESGEHVTVTGPLALVHGEHGTMLAGPPKPFFQVQSRRDGTDTWLNSYTPTTSPLEALSRLRLTLGDRLSERQEAAAISAMDHGDAPTGEWLANGGRARIVKVEAPRR